MLFLKNKPVVKIKKIENAQDLPLINYAHSGDAGLDLYANVEGMGIGIPAGGTALVPVGFKIELPEGYEAQIRPRSGMALKHGITVLNSPGTIDCFSIDCKLSTPNGDKNIKEFKIGDSILSINSETLEVEKDIVTEIYDKGLLETYEIKLEDGNIVNLTANTLVLTTKGYVSVNNLSKDDEIISLE